MYEHTLHSWRKHFCSYCLQVLVAKKILKYHIKYCFKKNNKKLLKFLQKVNILDPKVLKIKGNYHL